MKNYEFTLIWVNVWMFRIICAQSIKISNGWKIREDVPSQMRNFNISWEQRESQIDSLKLLKYWRGSTPQPFFYPSKGNVTYASTSRHHSGVHKLEDMHIIWNALFDSNKLGKGGMTFCYSCQKSVENYFSIACSVSRIVHY